MKPASEHFATEACGPDGPTPRPPTEEGPPAGTVEPTNDDGSAAPEVDPWIHHMRHGQFERAWEVSDAVLQRRRGVPCHDWPRHEQYVWNGESLAGKRVLVRCYHGLGDTIQFIRYARLLKGIAREVIVWAQSELIPLLESAAGIDRLVPLHGGAPEVDYDVDVELMELPHIFRSTLETLPRRVPYVQVPPDTATSLPPVRIDPIDAGGTAGRDAASRWTADHAGQRARVGIVWRSGGWDDRRSIPTRLLESLATVPGLELGALQHGAALDEWPSGWGPVWSTTEVRTLARRIRALDLVISVDSFPAHLAGALGVTTWTLLHSDPDWRWMLGRDDSPWYPTMRLWRQPRAGDWPRVMAAVRDELEVRFPA